MPAPVKLLAIGFAAACLRDSCHDYQARRAVTDPEALPALQTFFAKAGRNFARLSSVVSGRGARLRENNGRPFGKSHFNRNADLPQQVAWKLGPLRLLLDERKAY